MNLATPLLAWDRTLLKAELGPRLLGQLHGRLAQAGGLVDRLVVVDPHLGLARRRLR